MTTFAAIAGGGTSGHVLPALAVAEALNDIGHSWNDLLYFGTRRGIEVRLVPPTGLRAEYLDVVGLKREISGSALRNNLLFVPKLVHAWWQALSIMRGDRPRVVVSVGGYGSLPAVLAAWVLRIPIVVATYDRTPGRSSALTSRFAVAVAAAFPDSPLPRSSFTGAPVRRELRHMTRSTERSAARQRLGIAQERFCVGIIGGSLGSGILNDTVRLMAQRSAMDGTLTIRHAVGDRFYESFRKTLQEAGVRFSEAGPGTSVAEDFEGVLQYQITPYEQDMRSLYAAVDVLVGRGGAGTVAEIAATGTPAILVPWSGAADAHQHHNVRWLADRGGAITLDERDCSDKLPLLIDTLRADPQRLATLAGQAHVLGASSRQGAIAELVERVAASSEAT